jgi:AmmeMemoRadiSam system protein B
MTDQTLPDHLHKPHVRPVQPIPMTKDGKQYVALRDPTMLSPQTMVVPIPAMQVIQHFRGEQTIDQIAAVLNGPVEQLLELARGLDTLGLLWGPTFERLEDQLRERVRAAGAYPVNSSASLGPDEAACRKSLKDFFAQTEDPEIADAPRAIVAPHLDYQRGWPNYAAAYYNLRDTAPPDRVVILGTNHFGIGDGVVLSEFGFQSPLGKSPADSNVIEKLVGKLGRPLIVDQLDHVGEHSVELHMPWIQYCWGNVPVIGALIPDPLGTMIADDGARTKSDAFLDALSGALKDAGGKTFFVASSDLSHVGPQFGEPRAVDEQRRFDVERHDREMMGKFIAGDAEEFIAAFKWNKNPTRWCSLGNMSALLTLVQPESVELIDYRQAYDEQGQAMVTSAAMALA